MLNQLLKEDQPAKEAPIRVLLVSGEASSDQHGAHLVENIKALSPDSEIFGMGGSALRRAGMETIVDSEKHAAVMGLTELFGSLSSLYKAFQTLLREARLRKPDVVVLIDFPDFNLRLAKRLKKSGASILYYVTPQLWAWRKGRIAAIRRDVRKVAPIFPFEESYFQQAGVDAEYVGHPFLDRPQLNFSRRIFLNSFGANADLPVLALLPGSRKAEAERLLEPMLAGFALLREGRPGLQAVIPVASTLSLEWFQERVRNVPGVYLVSGRAREVLACAEAAVVASGTATVETALEGVPQVVVYRLSPLTHFLARRLVKGVPYFAMVNLIAGKKIVPELLQEKVTGETIRREIEQILGDPGYALQMKRNLSIVRERLQRGKIPGRSTTLRTAEIVFELANERRAGKRPGNRQSSQGGR